VTNLCTKVLSTLDESYQLPLEAYNYHLQPILMFAKSRHLRLSYCSALAEAQNSLLTYLRGFPLGQCRNSHMMAEARGFPDCSGGFHSHSSLSWCESSSDSVPSKSIKLSPPVFEALTRYVITTLRVEIAGYFDWIDSQEQRWRPAPWVISFQIRGASAISF
jgi:hypothetical protein